MAAWGVAVNFTLLPGVNFQGADIRHTRVPNATQCSRACATLRPCLAFTFIVRGRAAVRCWLKGEGYAEHAEASGGTVSGVKHELGSTAGGGPSRLNASQASVWKARQLNGSQARLWKPRRLNASQARLWKPRWLNASQASLWKARRLNASQARLWRARQLNATAPGENVQFIHITSAAGTAIETWGRQHGLRWGRMNRALSRYFFLSSPSERREHRIVEAWHTPPALLTNNPDAKVGDRHGVYCCGAHTFCVARHPVCRMISAFRCMYRKGWGIGGTFRQWFVDIMRPGKARNGLDGSHPSFVHGMPTMPWYDCDTYLRFEHLQQDFTNFVHAYLPHLRGSNTTLPHISRHRPLAYRLDKDDLRIIADTMPEDFSRFNYSLEDIPCSLSGSGH